MSEILNRKMVTSNEYCYFMHIDKVPLSINHIYSQNKSGRRFLTKEAKSFKHFIKYTLLANYTKDEIPKYTNMSLHISLFLFREDLICKNGKIRKMDISNSIKLIEDAFFDFLNNFSDNFDDSKVNELCIRRKIVMKNRAILFKVSPLPLR